MTYKLVEALGDDGPEVALGGRTFPSLCIVEDEDAIRLLVTHRVVLRDIEWAAATHEGVSALLLHDEGSLAWVTTEQFIEERTESDGRYALDRERWAPLDEPPGRYLDLELSEREHTGGFVSLHTHAEFSALDGMSRVDEMVNAAASDGQPAVALTDHGKCAGHPVLQKECDRAGIKPIFGIEAYFCDDRFSREESDQHDYWHLVLWAETEQGLRNLWAMSSQAHIEGHYYRPRMDWETLRTYSEGVMASTACLRGPLAADLLEGREEQAQAKLARLMDIFPDRLYVEVHTNQLDEQKELNKRLVKLADSYDLPLVAVTDSHYPDRDDHEHHQVWIAAQTNSDLQDEADLFGGNQRYHMHTEDEVRAALAYLGEEVVEQAVGNTVKVAERCTATIESDSEPPVFYDSIATDVDRLVDLCMDNWEAKKLPGPGHPDYPTYVERFEREMKLLINKDFCGYFLMVADYVRWAKRDGILVGPGRGSGGGSLVAYLCDITTIDPIDAGLLFERFLTPGRTSLPDFDVDFPASKRDVLQQHLVDKYGEDHVVRVGTHSRLKNKGVIRDMARVLQSSMDLHWPDIDIASDIIDEAESDTAGLGMDWDDLWDIHGDLEHPDTGQTLNDLRDKYPVMFRMADRLVGRLKTYAKHAAGFVIDPDVNLTENLPLRVDDDGNVITEYDMDTLEALGYIKFDLLTLRTLDTIQIAMDLVREKTGEPVDIYGWEDEYDDPEVWDTLSDGNVLGVFQVEKVAGEQMCRRLKPRSVADLAAVITLIRPGPMRSGLTDLYLRRRHGKESVVYPHERLADVLDETYGCMVYQEDVMNVCKALAGYDLEEADHVRRILGKKKVELAEAEGRKFVKLAVETGVDRDVAVNIWDQMAEFAKYSFNRAHAWEYAVIGHWCAWFKVKYPVEFLTAAMSTVDKDRIPDFVREARRLGIKVMPPDINESGMGFTATDEGVRYGLDSVKGVGTAGAEGIMAHQPYESYDDFLERAVNPKGSKCNMGHVETLASVGAFDSIYPNRAALEERVAQEKSGEAEWCVYQTGPGTNREAICTFDWSEEPPPISKKTGKPLKKKPPPKRCTKGCRQYVCRDPLDPDTVEPYTDADIREREKEMLEVYLSSTPFDVIPDDVMDRLSSADDISEGINGEYMTVGLITRVKPYTDRANRSMAFLSVEDPDGRVFDVTVFSSLWKKHKSHLDRDRLILATVGKTDRGVHLERVEPL